MNSMQFVSAVLGEYNSPTPFQLTIFEEWVKEINDKGVNFETLIRDLIKTKTSFKTFPSYETYSALYVSGGKASEYTLSAMNRLEVTKAWEPRQIYMKFRELFFRDISELNMLQKEFLVYWGDFHSIICSMIDRKFEKETIANHSLDVRNMVIAGDSFGFMYKKYFKDETVNNKFTKLINDENREGMSIIENYF